MMNQNCRGLPQPISIIADPQEAYLLFNTKKISNNLKKVDSEFSESKNPNRPFGKSDSQPIKSEKCWIYKK